jgi:hypothetical protein
VVARHWFSRLTTAGMIWVDAPACSLRVCPCLPRSLTGCGRTTYSMQVPAAACWGTKFDDLSRIETTTREVPQRFDFMFSCQGFDYCVSGPRWQLRV